MMHVSLKSLLLSALMTGSVFAQTAEISGLISDPSGLSVPNATLSVRSPETGATRRALSNQQGIYSIPALPPGAYDLSVEATGFKSVHQNRIVLEVDQRATLDFTLSIGNTAETVTVEGSAPLLNVSDASVSTVIGNQFVDNLPLNGRSFSSLIPLAPGVVLTPANYYEQGQFSVNGQHPDANYFMVDGVSANLGTAGSGANVGQGGAGQLPATSAFGGTSNLVSLDALEEFRIQTSTFAPEYGRTPGAQVSVVTKSGTNAFHGTVFEYFRNDKLDANDWFANANGLAKPELRQNDFGGVLGGPIRKDKLFFFGSWESVRVRQPHIANTYEPTLASREQAAAAIQPLLKAFPLPNGKDLGNGTAAFSEGYSDPSSLDSYSIRADYLLSSKIIVFARYSDAPSDIGQRSSGTNQRNYNTVEEIKYRTQSATFGSNQLITPRLTNEFRFNYSRSRAHSYQTIDNFGGGTPPPASLLFPPGRVFEDANFSFFGDFNPYGLSYQVGELGNNVQRQINLTDNVSFISGAHQVKVGIDYRRLSPKSDVQPYAVQYIFGSLANAIADQVSRANVASRFPEVLVFSNWSVFAQDTWKATRKLTITYGLRWDYNAAPSSPNGTLPMTVIGVDNLATVTLAPFGTPLWKATKDNFAPRLGIAWQPFPNWVFRAGAGIFYDLGYSDAADGASAFPYANDKVITNTSFPLSAADTAPVPFSTAPPVVYLAVVNPHHVLPRTYEWNAALERTLGRSDVFTTTYVGTAGRKLMRQDIFVGLNPNFPGEFDLMGNRADSSYHALQLQFRHRFSRGLQVLLSYSWAHSIDDASSDVYFANVSPNYAPLSQERGSSDYDIRHTFSGAVSYNIPAPGEGILKTLFGNWSTDSIVYARSAPPANVVTGADPFFATVGYGQFSAQRPNLVRGAPLWTSDPNVAGGRRINKAAFATPNGSVQGDLGRNVLSGFGATQVDLTLRRQFRLWERLSLQARADLFNIFNHPNFAQPINYLTSPQFGQSTQMLGTSLGNGGQGGLSPLFQIGGPRSAQLALKLLF